MAFEDEVNRYRQELQPRPKPVPPPAPDWHSTLVESLTEHRVPQVTLYRLRGRKDTPLRPFVDHVEDYAPLCQGWVLHYTVEYREGYLTSGQFFISEKFSHAYPTWTESRHYDAGGGLNARRPTRTVRRGLPAGGGWHVHRPTGFADGWASTGAALIVALLREGKSLRPREHGAFGTI